MKRPKQESLEPIASCPAAADDTRQREARGRAAVGQRPDARAATTSPRLPFTTGRASVRPASFSLPRFGFRSAARPSSPVRSGAFAICFVFACSPSGGALDAGPDAAIDGAVSDARVDAPADASTEAAPPIEPTPYACPANAPEAVFVSEIAPPATMTPWQHANVSVTYANCGTQTWSATKAPPDGIKLGPSGPHDLATWSQGRIALPADVPPSYAIEIPIEIHAPALTGTHAYSFELVRDGVAWLGQPSPTHAI